MLPSVPAQWMRWSCSCMLHQSQALSGVQLSHHCQQILWPLEVKHIYSTAAYHTCILTYTQCELQATSPTTWQPLIFPNWPTMDPTAPAAPLTTRVCPSLGSRSSNRPKYAVALWSLHIYLQFAQRNWQLYSSHSTFLTLAFPAPQ